MPGLILFLFVLSLPACIFMFHYFEVGVNGEYKYYRNAARQSKTLKTKHLSKHDKIFGRIIFINKLERYGESLPYYVGNVIFEGRTNNNINYASVKGHQGILIALDPYQLEYEE